MGERGGLAPRHRMIISQESPGEGVGESAAQLPWRPEHCGDTGTMEGLPRTAAVSEWSWPEPRGKLHACAVEGFPRPLEEAGRWRMHPRGLPLTLKPLEFALVSL